MILNFYIKIHIQCEKCDFKIVAEKFYFSVLPKKCDFVVLAGKRDFAVFAEKCDFANLAGKHIFVFFFFFQLKKSYILRYMTLMSK